MTILNRLFQHFFFLILAYIVLFLAYFKVSFIFFYCLIFFNHAFCFNKQNDSDIRTQNQMRLPVTRLTVAISVSVTSSV